MANQPFSHIKIGFWGHTLLFTLLSLLNILTLGTTINLVVTIPELLIVIAILFLDDNPQRAIILNSIFILTCVSALNAVGLVEDDSRYVVIYSYSRLKLIGPIGFSYVIWILILIKSLLRSSKLPKETLFYKLFKYLLFLFISGNIIGIFGFIIDQNHSWFGFRQYNVYMIITIIVLLCFLLNYSPDFAKRCYRLVFPLFTGTIISTLISFFFFGFTTSYGAYGDIILQPDILYYGIVLLLSFCFVKEKGLILLLSLTYIMINFSSPSGKSIIFIALGLAAFIIMLLSKTNYPCIQNNKRKRMYGIFICILAICFVVVLIPKISIEGNLFAQKFHDVTSLFSGSLDKIDRSPYIRMATILNIIDNNINHPIYLLFGRGYGGYFVDSLHLFDAVKLDSGAFADEMIITGRYATAHDTFAVVPLLNGLFGLFLIFKICWLYIKKTKVNFLCFAAVIWLLFTFYYNTQYAMTGIFFLFASEYIIQKDEHISR